jgi:hypothetical protein
MLPGHEPQKSTHWPPSVIGTKLQDGSMTPNFTMLIPRALTFFIPVPVAIVFLLQMGPKPQGLSWEPQVPFLIGIYFLY